MIPIIYKYKYKYLDNIDYHELSLNTSAIDIINIYIKYVPHVINWEYLSSNTSAISILEKILIKYVG